MEMKLVDQKRRNAKIRRRSEPCTSGIVAWYWYAIAVQNFIALPTVECFICSNEPFGINQKDGKVGLNHWNLFMSSTPNDNERMIWSQPRYSSSVSLSSPSTISKHYVTKQHDTKQRQQRLNSRRKRQKMKPLPILGYNSRAILEYYDLRPLEVGWRLNSLGFPLLGKF